MNDVSVLQVAKSLQANRVSGMAQAVGLKWPPPPTISVRDLVDLVPLPSITTWTRLEPRTRTDDMAPSLEGWLYDPAWLLGRQWQAGEFVGEDAGSPIHAELQVVSSPITAYQSGTDGTDKPRVCGQVPLDALAGPEPRAETPAGCTLTGATLFESAEAGAQLLALLATHGCSAAGTAALVTQHPLPAPAPGTADAQGVSYLGLLAGRLPHAIPIEPLARQAVANGTVPDAVGIPASDHDAFIKAAAEWTQWLDGLMARAPAEGDAWVDASLDHQFTVCVTQPASTTAAVPAGSVTLPISWVDGIAVGMSVRGLGIPADTTVVATFAVSIALSQALSAKVSQGSNISFGGSPLALSTNADAPAGSITLPFAFTQGIEVGMPVSGPNILQGTTVTALTASVLLNKAVSGDVPLASNVAFLVALVAPAWDGERTDWYDLDADLRLAPPTVSGPAPPLPRVDPATGSLTAAGPPAPLAYPGMPPHRWWQFDEGHVNFAQVAASKDDLARMLVVEFASLYSNDWYLWPLRLPVASLNVVQTLNVTNTFGETIAIGPAGSAAGEFSTVGDWCVFRPTVRAQAQPSALNGLLLPAALADEQRSEPFEAVTFMRDEVAELAWAIERTVIGSDGRPLDRHSTAVSGPNQAPASNPTASSDSSPLRYQLATDVPPFWFPLAPDPDPNKSIFHRLLLRAGSDGQPVQPSGTILRPGASLTIRQEEVPREGAEVRRSYHLTRGLDRGVDGAVLVAVFLWVGRSKRAGRGKGSSGLRYDSAIG